jgi:hypothetical protein
MISDNERKDTNDRDTLHYVVYFYHVIYCIVLLLRK